MLSIFSHNLLRDGAGLGIYDDSEDSDSENEAETTRPANGEDSDEDIQVCLLTFCFLSTSIFRKDVVSHRKFELQEVIRKRKQEFSLIEKEIEKKLAEEEERERRNNEDDDEEDEEQTKRRGSERGGGYKGEAQVESQKSGSNLHLSHHGEYGYGIVDKILFFRLLGVNFQMESDKRPLLLQETKLN